jgi:hypothetical protein
MPQRLGRLDACGLQQAAADREHGDCKRGRQRDKERHGSQGDVNREGIEIAIRSEVEQRTDGEIWEAVPRDVVL